MKKLSLLLLSCLLFLGMGLKGSEIKPKQAIKVANNFYFERNQQKEPLDYNNDFTEDILSFKSGSTVAYYIVNYKNNGWIAISATDKSIPIIAYSYVGRYDGNKKHDNFKAWMLQYKLQLIEAIESNVVATKEASDLWAYYLANNGNEFLKYRIGRNVEPLILTTWDQGIYYNEMCPVDGGGPGGHCLTGCVPTCMGQIANYFRFPQTGVGSYSYDGGPYGTLSANFGESYYNWNEMPASVTTNSIETAEILFHFGVSCDLVYGPDGSGMYNHKAAYALRTYFKYSPETEYLYRDSTNLNWDSVIIAHLDQKIPMYYAGWSVPNLYGHAFVCDGYENDNYFHFNWGWSGSNDGYFYTGNLNPGGNNFNLAQELIINCFPDTNAYTYPYYCNGNDTVVSLAGTIDDGSGPIYDYMENQSCTWLISPIDSIQSITLTYYSLDIDISDTLYIYDGNSADSDLLGSFTGNELPEDITSSGDELFISFSSDGQNNSDGWLIGYTCETPTFCSNNVFTEFEGQLSDGSGPANYQNLTACLWMIHPPDVDEITLTFSEFNTEENHDFVTIYDNSTKIGEYSGHELPPVLHAYSGNMTIVFSTNSSIVDQGWTATYTASTVGVELNAGGTNVELYPVPANNEVYIDVNQSSKDTKLRLFNIYGSELIMDIVKTDDIYILNTTTLEDGLYIIELTDGDITITKKLIIKH